MPLTECLFHHSLALPSILASAGLFLSILLWQQDCSPQSCADSKIAPVHYKLGLGTVLARVTESARLLRSRASGTSLTLTTKGRPLAKSASRSSV